MNEKKPPLKLKFNFLENNKDLMIYGSTKHPIPSQKQNTLAKKGNHPIIVIYPTEKEAK